MQQRELTFRIFVSSTFSDLKAERNALQEYVFPRLREYCQTRGARFQAIDLRWGVSEEAALDQQTMNICLEELRRCQRTSPRPNFIVLLGQRYGWCPLPPQIAATEFEPIRDQITLPDDQALLAHWYRRDENAVPPEYCLQPRPAEAGKKLSQHEQEVACTSEARQWNETESRLRAILLTGVTRLVWPLTDERRLKYEASATHQEILHGALQVKNTTDHVFGFFRTIESIPQDARAGDFLDLGPQGRPDVQARARLERLQSDLRSRLPKNILSYSSTWSGSGPTTDHLQQLCKDVYNRIRMVIDEELQRRDRSDPVDQEVLAHQTFGQERARVFIGRRDQLQAIQNYLDSEGRHPLIVHGLSGSGKSALLARAVADHESRGTAHEVIVRYIGATPVSSDIRALLEGLCKEISLRYGGDASTVPMEYNKLAVELTNRMALATAKRPLVLFLDALDQLSEADQGRSLAWLPAQLPEHVRLVVSTLPGECLTALKQRQLPAASYVEVTPMNPQEGEEVLTAWLCEAHRVLRPQQRDDVLAGFRDCPYPLYLKLAFEEARRWKSFNPIRTEDCAVASEEQKSSYPRLSHDIPGILNDMFTRLEAERNHGRVLVSCALGYLVASRHGLTEGELLDVLSADQEVMADFRRRSPRSPALDRLPVVVWARLFADIEPYMTQRQADGTTVLTFYHWQVGKAVERRHLAEGHRLRKHLSLARLFHAQGLFFETPEQMQARARHFGLVPRPVNIRKVAELPFHQLASAKLAGNDSTSTQYWNAVADLLTDWRFLEAKAEADPNPGVSPLTGKKGGGHLIFELADDLRQVVDQMPPDHPALPKLILLYEAMIGTVMGLTEQPARFTQTMTNRLRLRPLSPAAQELLRQGESLLCSHTWWLKSEDGIVESKLWDGIVAVSLQRGLVYCTQGEDRIVDCLLASQKVVSEHRLPTTNATETAVCPGDGRLATVTTDGSVYTVSGQMPIRLRQRSNCFAGLGNGFIGIDPQGNLIYWTAAQGAPDLLAAEMPARGCSVSITATGNAAVVVAGDRAPAQRLILITSAANSSPACRVWKGDKRIVTAAALSEGSKLLAFATTDRRLTVISLETEQVLGTVSLSQSPGRPLAEVTRCACTCATGSSVRVVFAVADGVLGVWDLKTGQIQRVGAYRGLDTGEPLICLDWLADSQHFVVATRDSLKTVGISEQITAPTAAARTAITACAVGADRWVSLIQEKAQRITWYHEGAIRETFYHPAFRPCSIASHGLNGEVLAGGHGALLLLRPGQQPQENDSLNIFDRPLVTVLPQDAQSTVAVSETGEIKLVRLAEEWVKPAQPPWTHWKQEGACWLGSDQDIVCWGRTISDACSSEIHIVHRRGTTEKIFTARGLIAGVACTDSGRMIHVGVDEEVITYARRGATWEPHTRRLGRITHLAPLGKDHLVAVLANGCWLEVWSTNDPLQTVGVCYIPVSVRCLSTCLHLILIGTNDGRHILIDAIQPKGKIP